MPPELRRFQAERTRLLLEPPVWGLLLSYIFNMFPPCHPHALQCSNGKPEFVPSAEKHTLRKAAPVCWPTCFCTPPCCKRQSRLAWGTRDNSIGASLFVGEKTLDWGRSKRESTHFGGCPRWEIHPHHLKRMHCGHGALPVLLASCCQSPSGRVQTAVQRCARCGEYALHHQGSFAVSTCQVKEWSAKLLLTTWPLRPH